MKSTTYKQITKAIQELGLENSVICMHSSLKSFGHLEGGADTLIQGFLDLGCTIVVPTFTYDCRVPAPVEKRILRNGCVYPYDPEHVEAFDRDSVMVSSDMGTIPARILGRKERVRGIHPMNSFAAIGPLAEVLIAKQTHLNVYGPLKMMYEIAESYVGLIGVDLTSTTAIHYAEEKAGRNLFRQWALEKDGTQREIAVGSCSDGFTVFDPYVKEMERSIRVGESKWRLFPFQPFIDVITEAIVKSPEITHCSNADCIRCNDAVRGGPLL